mmetsp:Transcript_22256/g.24746  ORF Transcript_22256/g.24746 Transcript_22256/m.24746 type:complete len:91 (+) Transcript_22256:162-434(+)
MLNSFKNMEKVQIENFDEYESSSSLERIVRAVSKLISMSKSKIKSSSKPRVPSTVKDITTEIKPKLFIIGGGKANSMRPTPKKPSTKLTY